VRRPSRVARTAALEALEFISRPSDNRMAKQKPKRSVRKNASANDVRRATHDELLADDPRPTTDDVFRRRIAYLECFSGISGDMFLGALIDAGVAPEIFQQAVANLNVGATLEFSRVNRNGIIATKVDVLVDGKKDQPREAHAHEPHPHDHPHDHHHDAHHHRHPHRRGLSEIRKLIREAEISEPVKKTAIRIFENLGEAESKIHNVPIQEIHFHEVGAVDALVDIVCAAVGAQELGVDEFICSPLNVGGGTVECAHGTFPVPAPATVELLKGAPVYSSGIQSELVTPTGAAIVTTLAQRFESFPPMTIEKLGYGAGTRDFPGHANVLRISVGDATDIRPDRNDRATQAAATHGLGTPPETITALEANLDDLNPQVFGYVMDKLLEAGALDVFGTAVQMKKNRPGTLLTVLGKPEDADHLTKIIFDETTTLGVRRRDEQRQVLARRWQSVSTRFGEVRMKIASMNGTVTNYAPEYEDCKRIAAEHRVPLKAVMQEAVLEYLQSSKKE